MERLTRMWVTEMDQPMMVRLARSMPRRIEGVLAAQGGHTKY